MQEGLIALFFRWIALLFGIHLVAFDFVVPPGEAEVGRDHVRAGMNVANHALARRNRARENMLYGMARLIFGDRGIGGSAESGVAVCCVGAGVQRVAIIRVDHVAGGAAAAAIVAGMIVRAGERHLRIHQTRLLQAQENGIGAELCAEAAVAEFVLGLAGIFFAI